MLRGRSSAVGPAGRAPAGTLPIPTIFAPGGAKNPPAYGASGAMAVGGAGAALAVAYPAGLAAGDLLILCTSCKGTNLSTVPAGWTRIGPGTPLLFASGYGDFTSASYWRFADGTESGSVTVTNPADQGAAVMHRIANVKQSSNVDAFLESYGEDDDVNSVRHLTHQAITTAGKLRLAVVLGYRGGDNVVSNDMTGETGADLTERNDQSTTFGYNHGLALFAGAVEAAGTVSGGVSTTSGAASGWASQSFALVPAA